MQEIVINRCWGGYSLSQEAKEWLLKQDALMPSYVDLIYANSSWRARSDKHLIQCIKELGERADGEHASLEIVSIPDDVEWQIIDHDGWEHIAEKHRVWP